MASETIDFGVGRILSVLENEVVLQRGIGGEVEKMKEEMIFMKSFLEDTNKHLECTRSKLFCTFVAKTRDLAYQVEDIIDEFNYLTNGSTWLQRLVCFPCNIWSKRSIACKLKEVNEKLVAMSDSMRKYSLIGNFQVALSADSDGTKRMKNLGESSLFFSDDSLVGVDEARRKLTSWLLDAEPQRMIVSVVGMGGSGKTTLAANIFKSEGVGRRFDSCAWVTISQTYVIEDVFRNMIKELYKQTDLQIPHELSTMRYKELVEMLVHCLGQKRYIVVLDDVWSIGLWSEISVALPNSNRGSRVMITTRNEAVASFSYGTRSQVFRIEPLDEKEAWELFCRKAFLGNFKQRVSPNITSIGRELVHKCQGLPLAIVAIGSLMSTKKLETQWKQVHNSLNWELRNNPELKVVHSILLFSFNELSYPLKCCFLYCCVFPEDYEIKRNRLIRMWMAQGFVEPVRGAKPEDVAESYLMELVCRNMVKVVERNHVERPKVLKMHDVIREIAMLTCKAERFCDVYDDDDATKAIRDDGTRHACIRRGMRSDSLPSNLRTLLMCCTSKLEVSLPTGLKFLRVLDLKGTFICKLPASLVTLYNLKYLNLTRTRVYELPKSFHRLLNLETLITKQSNIEMLPPGISKLRNLRHLVTFRYNRGHGFGWDYLSGTKVSSSICQLKDLQVMDCIIAEGELIKKLGNMTQLTRLGLIKLRKDHGDDLCKSLGNIKDLHYLSLKSIDEEEPLHIDALKSATSIKQLYLEGKLKRLPSWFKTLHNLTSLSLCWSRLEDDAVSCIQTLPSLVRLTLFSAYEGNSLCFTEGFQNLKILKIGRAPHLVKISIRNGVMPDLQKLWIGECKELKSVPDGIESLVHLRELVLGNVSDQLLESVSGKGTDRAKIKHIPIIKLRNNIQ